MEKLKVKEEVKFDIWSLDGQDIVTAVGYINELHSQLHNKGCTNIRFDIDISPYYDGVDNDSTLYGEREETEEEVQQRLKQQDYILAQEKQKEQQELEQYIRLKAKYDNLDILSITVGDTLIVTYKNK